MLLNNQIATNQQQALHILLIEDNPGDQLLIEEYLHEVIQEKTITFFDRFSNVKKYFSQPDINKPDIILLDLRLPDMEGKELISEMLFLAGSIPIIVLTGLTDMKFSVSSLTMGISDYLLKDEISSGLLLKSIRYSIERKRILEEMRELHSRTVDLQEMERIRLGRELHDEIGQYGVRLKMDLFALKSQVLTTLGSGSEAIEQKFDNAIDLVQSFVKQIKHIVNDLRPPLLEEFGLLSAMETYIKQLDSSNTNTSIIFDFDYQELQVSNEWSVDVYRFMQEAVTNALKHANASLITVTCRFESFNQFILQIEDNGEGFKEITDSETHWGLTGMKERASKWGGRVHISSVPNKGTLIELTIPISRL